MADKLTQCSISEAWSILRTYITTELLGDELIPVPYVTEADLYDLMTVFYKLDDKRRPCFCQSILSILAPSRTYEVLGPLPNLMDMSRSNRTELEYCSRPRTEEVGLPAQYTCDLYGRGGKEIHLSVVNPHKKIILLTGTQPGDLVIDRMADPVLDYIDRIYLITEVVYSAGVELVVTANGTSKQYSSTRLLPLAFGYQKFPIARDGGIYTQLPSSGDMRSMVFRQLRQRRQQGDSLPEAPRTSISARLRPAARRNPRDGLPLLPAAGADRGPPPPLPPPDHL